MWGPWNQYCCTVTSNQCIRYKRRTEACNANEPPEMGYRYEEVSRHNLSTCDLGTSQCEPV